MADAVPLEEAIERFGTFAPALCACGHTLHSHRPPVYECIANDPAISFAEGPYWVSCNCDQFTPACL